MPATSHASFLGGWWVCSGCMPRAKLREFHQRVIHIREFPSTYWSIEACAVGFSGTMWSNRIAVSSFSGFPRSTWGTLKTVQLEFGKKSSADYFAGINVNPCEELVSSVTQMLWIAPNTFRHDYHCTHKIKNSVTFETRFSSQTMTISTSYTFASYPTQVWLGWSTGRTEVGK